MFSLFSRRAQLRIFKIKIFFFRFKVFWEAQIEHVTKATMDASVDHQRIIRRLEDYEQAQVDFENKRLGAMQKNKATKIAICVQAWTLICRSMANDRAPWFVMDNDDTRWKQDSVSLI